MNLFLFWRLKVNLSSPHGEELEGLWSKWPFPREFITQFTKKPIEKNQFIGKTWKGLFLWHELDFLLSLSWLFVVHTARWDYSNLIPLRWIPRVNIVQMCPWNNCPKTQFRSKSRCHTRQWPRMWWIWTKRRRRSSLTRQGQQDRLGESAKLILKSLKCTGEKRRLGYMIFIEYYLIYISE